MVRKRILLLTDSLGGGGAQRQLVGLASLLQNKGYQVKVMVYFDIPFYKPFLDERGIEIINVVGGESKYRRIFKLNKAILSESPDVLISYQETPSLIACLLKSVFHRSWKLIVSERSYSIKNGIRERIRFYFYRYADNIVPNSYSQKKFIELNYPILSPKIGVIPNFVDLNYFKSNKKNKYIDRPEILVAASVWAPKNVIDFIKAIKIAKEKNSNFHVTWYGLSEHLSEYEIKCLALIKDYKLDSVIELKKKTHDIKSKYLDADFFCLPSIFEGTSNVICEAISCSLPVICSDVSDNSLYVQNNRNGYLFDPKSLESISNCILKIISLDTKTYERFCIHSRKVAELHLSETNFVYKYISLIES